MEEVKCKICKKVFSSADADKHRKETGHNSWELVGMWEKFKELGFTTVAIAIMSSNLATFIIIITQGIYTIWEPYPWILYTEALLDSCFIAWGIERLVKDLRR